MLLSVIQTVFLLKKYFSVTLVLLIKIKKIRIIEDVKSKKAL